MLATRWSALNSMVLVFMLGCFRFYGVRLAVKAGSPFCGRRATPISVGGAALNRDPFRSRIDGMKTINSKERRIFNGARKCGTFLSAVDPISEIKGEVNSDHERNPTMKTESENFFSEPADPQKEGLAMRPSKR